VELLEQGLPIKMVKLAKATGSKTKSEKYLLGIEIALLSHDWNLCRLELAESASSDRLWRLIVEDLMGGSLPGILPFPS